MSQNKSAFQFKLGQTVKNIVVGTVGSISARSENLTGCRRYLVANKAGDGKLLEEWYGEAELTLKKDVPKDFAARYRHKEFEFALGSEVEDMISKSKMVITMRTEYSPGFNRYAGSSPVVKEGKKADEMVSFDEAQLRQVGTGISKKLNTEVEEVKAKASRNPAGPPRKEAY
jgi:hypothetical protein